MQSKNYKTCCSEEDKVAETQLFVAEQAVSSDCAGMVQTLARAFELIVL